ncbi:MAG: hypothetical protein ABH844_01505 [Candidatus Omnitrophota bacterium]
MKQSLLEIEKTYNSDQLTKSDLVNSMINFRLSIEERKYQSKHKILNLYCNWILHNEISGSATAFRILEELTDSMIVHNDGQSSGKWINDAIIEGVKLHRLQAEILDFAKEFNINLKIFKSLEFWKSFGGILLSTLVQRPLKFPKNLPNPKMKKIYNSIVQKTTDSGYLVNGVIALSFVSRESKIHWKIGTLDPKNEHVVIIGPMAVITQEMVDSSNV